MCQVGGMRSSTRSGPECGRDEQFARTSLENHARARLLADRFPPPRPVPRRRATEASPMTLVTRPRRWIALAALLTDLCAGSVAAAPNKGPERNPSESLHS